MKPRDTWYRIRLAVIIVACGAASAVHAQNGQFPFPPIGYTLVYCESPNGEWCGYPGSSRVTALVDTEGPYDSSPTWSPDATAVAYSNGHEIIVAGPTGAVNITNTTATESFPAWSPDGRRIAFVRNGAGSPELFVMNPDGSDVERVAIPVALRWGRPSWAPDSERLAFGCNVVPGNDDICVIGSGGTGFLWLTDDPGSDADPAWSPDGAAIAFATTRYGTGHVLALISPDGSAVSRIGTGILGTNPAWSPDGRQLAFDYWADDGLGTFWPAISTMKADGSDIRPFAGAAMQPAWKPGLFVGFTVECSSLTCSFDGTRSVGDIVSYAWDFSDQMTTSGSVVSHEFAAAGTYSIVLTVTNTTGATATASWPVSVSRAPVASFTVSCDQALTCLFDWSSSYDPEGAALSMRLQFGDGAGTTVYASLPTALHTYNSPGTYTATLEVSDGLQSTTASRTFAVPTPVMHIGDLEATRTSQKNSRSALVHIAVHTSKHTPLGSALVSASWSDGTPASCITDVHGSCAIERQNSGSQAIVRLSVTGVSKENYVYLPAANHDPDGDSNGTTIATSRR